MKQLQFDDTSKIDIRYTLQRIVTKQEHTLEGTVVSMFSIYYIKQIFALTIKFKDRHIVKRPALHVALRVNAFVVRIAIGCLVGDGNMKKVIKKVIIVERHY